MNSLRTRSNKKRLPRRGKALLNHVIALTGIPAKHIRRELKTILEKKNIDVNKLTVDQLRVVVATYLREIMGSLLDRSSSKHSEH